MEKPKTLIAWKLKDLYQQIYPEIDRMFYFVDKKTSEEYVRVAWSDIKYYGTEIKTSSGQFDICVTADSNSAMVKDVMKELERRFG